MAKGSIRYKTGQNLEPIANAITYMGQSASKKDKPEVLGEKIKKISTDATAVEGNVLNGQTFYAGGAKKTGNMANRGAWTGRIGVNGKIAIPAGYHNGQGYVDQSITAKGSITPAVSVTGNNPMYVRMSQGAYFTNASSGYPETSVTLAQLRGAGLALQSELTAMTNDRNNWMNVANSRVPYTFKNYPYIKDGNAVGTITLSFTYFCKIRIRIFESNENEDFVPIFMFRHPNGYTSILLPFAYSSSSYNSYFTLSNSSGTTVASSNSGRVNTFFSMSLNSTYELYACVHGDYYYLNITPTSTGLTISCKKIYTTTNTWITAWCC